MDPSAYTLMAETEESHWWFRGRRAAIRALLEGLKLSRNAKILELGSGTGGNIELLQQYGSVDAMELDDHARQVAMQKTGLTILAGKLPNEIPFESNQYDVICLFDVLEHVQEDYETLVSIKRLLRPGGHLLITVPSYQWLWSPHDIALHHFRRYSYGQLKAVYEKAGYKAKRLSFFNMAVFPITALVRFTDKFLARERSSGMDVPSPFINNTLTLVSEGEAKVLRHVSLPYGSSLVAVLTPNE